jgi:hypothetical protein
VGNVATSSGVRLGGSAAGGRAPGNCASVCTWSRSCDRARSVSHPAVAPAVTVARAVPSSRVVTSAGSTRASPSTVSATTRPATGLPYASTARTHTSSFASPPGARAVRSGTSASAAAGLGDGAVCQRAVARTGPSGATSPRTSHASPSRTRSFRSAPSRSTAGSPIVNGRPSAHVAATVTRSTSPGFTPSPSARTVTAAGCGGPNATSTASVCSGVPSDADTRALPAAPDGNVHVARYTPSAPGRASLTVPPNTVNTTGAAGSGSPPGVTTTARSSTDRPSDGSAAGSGYNAMRRAWGILRSNASRVSAPFATVTLVAAVTPGGATIGTLPRPSAPRIAGPNRSPATSRSTEAPGSPLTGKSMAPDSSSARWPARARGSAASPNVSRATRGGRSPGGVYVAVHNEPSDGLLSDTAPALARHTRPARPPLCAVSAAEASRPSTSAGGLAPALGAARDGASGTVTVAVRGRLETGSLAVHSTVATPPGAPSGGVNRALYSPPPTSTT